MARGMIPADTARLHFREMTGDDLYAMSELLGDPEVMAFYPAPKSRAEAQQWIDRNRRRYAQEGYGLWIIETLGGEFVGDCGLTLQPVDDRTVLEVGYHVRRDLQGRGYATEAAIAARDLAARNGLGQLHAIIHPDNMPSQRVAEKAGRCRGVTGGTSDARRPNTLDGSRRSAWPPIRRWPQPAPST